MPGFQISTDAGNTEGPRHIIETARNHRFKLEVLEPFGSTSTGILLYLEKCTRPTPEFDQIVIHNGQDEIYRPGKSRWLPVEFTFYEVLNRGGIRMTLLIRYINGGVKQCSIFSSHL